MSLCGLELRAPRDTEWPILRMLLPETFAEGGRREYRLALRPESPRVVGAVSFYKMDNAIAGLRVHAVARFRRQGVGSWMVQSLVAGVKSIEGLVDLRKDGGAGEFAQRNGFARVQAVTTVETEIVPIREYLRTLRERIPLPAGAQVLPLSEAPFAEVAALHADHVAWFGSLNSWRGLLADAKKLESSPVVMVDGRVAGMMLGWLEGTTVVVDSLAVATEQRGGRVMLLLLAVGLDIAWRRGARRTRFSYTERNDFTRRLGERFGAELVGESGLYRRILG
jgi:GNAT superfamily N-acetyltransferase